MSIDAIWNMQYSKGMDIIGYSLETAAEVGRRLSEGQVGIVPCDTIYGLCGRADEERAERIYQIKRRPHSKSFITLMTLSQVEKAGLAVPEDILSRWPAPLTAIVAGPGGSTHAVRVPSDPYLQELLAVSGPIFSTSVNFSGEKSLLTFEDILPVFQDQVDFIVEAKGMGGGMASTLVDATCAPFKVLRQGAYII